MYFRRGEGSGKEPQSPAPFGAKRPHFKRAMTLKLSDGPRDMTSISGDFLVIGSGIAGLSFALYVAKYGKVVVVTKKRDSSSNTNHAQGGIAAVLDPSDSFESHERDTLSAGGGLCNKEAVRVLVEEGPSRIRELLEWGVEFSRTQSSAAYDHLDLGREGGHSKNRIVHAGDLTGREIEESLLKQARNDPQIELLQNHCCVELITDHHVNGTHADKHTCYGAYVFDTQTAETCTVRAKMVYLATGGAGQVYQHTTNPDIATGDGIACAYRAGANIANMEFIQFHPTTLYHPSAESFLISEALRGYGATLKDAGGREFMKEYHPMGSLAPRDVVARAIDNEVKRTGEPCVYLDIRHADPARTKERFPNISARCGEYGIDITQDLIPVVPAAHYVCGGVMVDIDGHTSIENLYAGGEVACTGVHGANRLASNSLLEAVVFSKRSARCAANRVGEVELISADAVPRWDDSGTVEPEEWILLSHNSMEIRAIMWDYVGIVRSNLRLKRALRRAILLEKEIEDFYKRTKIIPQLLELRNIVTTAKLIITCALKRKESRGLHYTTNYPDTNDRYWKHDTIVRNPHCL